MPPWICRVRAPAAVNVVLFFATLILTVAIPVDWERAVGFPDSADYLRQSGISIASVEFYAPHAAPGFYPRSFMVPLFYKLAGSDPHGVVLLQKIIHAISALLLASTLAMLVTSGVAKCVMIVAVYALMSWWTVVGWTTVILSESLSFSLWWCWISSALFFYWRRTRLSFFLHLVSVGVLAFTRDTWPYVLVFFYSGVVLGSFILRRGASRQNIALFALALLLFLLQQHTAAIGGRMRLPLLNNIAIRILPHESSVRWMTRAGMPQAEGLASRFRGRPSDLEKVSELDALYTDPGYLPLFQWLNTSGQTTYMRFLLTHPRQLLLRRETRMDLERMFAYNFSLYTGSAKGFSRAVENIFPVFRAGAVALLVLIVLLAFRRQNGPVFLIPLVGAGLCAFQAILCYHADALEVDRHLVVTQVMLDLIGLTCVALLFDLALKKMPLFRAGS